MYLPTRTSEKTGGAPWRVEEDLAPTPPFLATLFLPISGSSLSAKSPTASRFRTGAQNAHEVSESVSELSACVCVCVCVYFVVCVWRGANVHRTKRERG